MADQPSAVRARIFVSYSRKDATFVDRLVAELIARGYDAFLDREDISGGEAWKERLEQLILQADAVVFVISPDSVASPVCNWETQRTVELGKRLIPVCLKRVEDDSTPAQLSRLNYIFADQPELFEDTLRRIAEASDVDIAWVREHTRQVDLATRWEARERKADALLRGDELGAAERWLSQREPNAPDVPEALVEYLQASRAAEADALERERKNLRRMRTLQFGVGGLMAAAALILIGAGYGVTRLMSGLGARTSSTLATIARQAADAGRFDSAARHALAGLAGSRWWLIGYDARPAELQLRRAVAESRMAALFVAHREPVDFVAFSPDGAMIVTGSADDTARVWDVRTGVPVGTPLHAEYDIDEALFSLDGTRVVTVALAGSAQIWDTRTSRAVGAEIGTGEGTFVSAIGLAHDRTQLVVAISDGRLQRIDFRTGQLIDETTIMPGGMSNAALSADGSKLAAGDFDRGPFFVWNLSGERPARVQLRGQLPEFFRPMFSPDGSKLVTLEQDDDARLWDSSSGTPIGQLSAASRAAAFSPDGSILATSSSDGAIQLWDGRTGARRGEPLRGHEETISALVFSPDGARLASASHDGTVRLWVVAAPNDAELVLRGHEGEVRHIAFSLDGALLASASADGTVRVSEVGPAHHRQIGLSGQEGEGATITDVVFAAQSNLMATSANVGTIVLRNAETGAPIGAPLVGDEGSMVTLALAPGEERLASGSSTGAVQIWNVENGSADGEAMIAERDTVVALAYAPDGHRIAVGHSNGATELWDVAARRLVGEVRHDHRDTINAIAFSPDGARFATASDDGSVRVWDASTGAPIGSPLVHEGKVLDIRFETPRSLLTAGDNGGRRWDVESGAVRERWEIEDGYVSAAAISADGSRFGFAFPGSPAMQIELSTGARRSEPVDDNGSTWATRIAFSSDGAFMATGYAHGFIRLWDARTGVLLTEQMETNGSFLFRLRFSPDGRRIFSSSVHGGAWLTVLHPAAYEPLPQLLRRACDTTLRGGLSRFTSDEFRQAPVLNPATDADVCKPPNLWTRIGLNFRQ